MNREKVLKVVELYNRLQELKDLTECLEGASLYFDNFAKGETDYVNKLLVPFLNKHAALIKEEVKKEYYSIKDKLDEL